MLSKRSKENEKKSQQQSMFRSGLDSVQRIVHTFSLLPFQISFLFRKKKTNLLRIRFRSVHSFCDKKKHSTFGSYELSYYVQTTEQKKMNTNATSVKTYVKVNDFRIRWKNHQLISLGFSFL